jgi:hypothetical protein
MELAGPIVGPDSPPDRVKKRKRKKRSGGISPSGTPIQDVVAIGQVGKPNNPEMKNLPVVDKIVDNPGPPMPPVLKSSVIIDDLAEFTFPPRNSKSA